MQKFLDELKRTDGFLVVPHDGSRVRVHAPNGQMTFFPTKVGNGTALSNARAWARRHGLPEAKAKVKGASAAPSPASVGIPLKRPSHVPSPFRVPVAASSSVGVSAAAVVEEPDSSPTKAAEPVVEEPEVAPELAVAESGPALVPAVASSGVKLPEGHPAHPPAGALLVDEGDGVVSVKADVGPDLAEKFLEWNIDNRPITDRIVDSYARMMATGAWVPAACPPLHFADTGKLTDGQKRLLAVVQSGVTLRFTLVLGLPESAQDVVDTGQHRLVAHQLKINRYKNPMVVAAAVRALWLWDHGSLISHLPSPSNPELLDYVPLLSGEGYSIEDSASFAVGSGARKFLPQSVIAATHFRMSRVDPDAAAEFHGMLSSGAGMEEGSPVLALRETMLRRQSLKQTLRQAEQIFLVVRAWQFWREGRTDVARLQFPRDRLTMAHISAIL